MEEQKDNHKKIDSSMKKIIDKKIMLTTKDGWNKPFTNSTNKEINCLIWF